MGLKINIFYSLKAPDQLLVNVCFLLQSRCFLLFEMMVFI